MVLVLTKITSLLVLLSYGYVPSIPAVGTQEPLLALYMLLFYQLQHPHKVLRFFVFIPRYAAALGAIIEHFCALFSEVCAGSHWLLCAGSAK